VQDERDSILAGQGSGINRATKQLQPNHLQLEANSVTKKLLQALLAAVFLTTETAYGCDNNFNEGARGFPRLGGEKTEAQTVTDL
jgi:hypothetical protein